MQGLGYPITSSLDGGAFHRGHGSLHAPTCEAPFAANGTVSDDHCGIDVDCVAALPVPGIHSTLTNGFRYRICICRLSTQSRAKTVSLHTGVSSSYIALRHNVIEPPGVLGRQSHQLNNHLICN